MDVVGTTMKMLRGDSEYITVSVKDDVGQQIPFVTGDIVYMTVKKNVHMTEKAFQKKITSFINGDVYIEILPGDTNNLSVGDYVYDIQVNRADGRVTTIVPPSTFILMGDVTRE